MSRRAKKRRQRETATELVPVTVEPPPAVAYSQLPPYTVDWDTGDKFPGGYGLTRVLAPDYWTLRARSSELFEQNLYARGLVRRLVTNEINVGLHLECDPEEKILGLQEDALSEWSEDVENRFKLYADSPYLCDFYERETFGQQQAAARREAIVAGDVLCVPVQNPANGLPRCRLVSGACVQTPPNLLRSSKRVVDGVELDEQGRHTAFWIRQENYATGDTEYRRLPAWGEKSGRRLAWLYYGLDHRLGEVRGKPLLGIVLQSLKEIDRYRDSTQRKAVINSMLAMFVKKGEAKKGSSPVTGGAVRRSVESVTSSDGTQRRFRSAEMIPGWVIEELQQGEEPVAFPSHGTDEKFGDFEEAIIQAVAWCHEMPPEILRLAFSNNYSASQAAINEFKMYLNRIRTDFGSDFCKPFYEDWLLSQVLAGKIKAPGLLEAWRDAHQHDIYGAWVASDWAGHIKPAVDLTKLVAGYKAMVEEGFITRDRASRELTGTKFSKNVQKLALENKQVAEANQPLAELKAAEKPTPPEQPGPDDAAPPSDDTEDGSPEGISASPRPRLSLLEHK